MNILITGASGGIGSAICDELAISENVYATGRNEKKLKKVNAKKYCVCDLSSDIHILTEFILEHKIDVLVNNAGDYVYQEIDKTDNKSINNIFEINLIAPVRLISSAVKNMKDKNWGRIINIGSISGVMGEAYASTYSASKAGLIGLTKALALELAQFNITVNTINPGWVDTELGKNSIENSDFSENELLQIVPQRRYVEPKEVASLVKYLISDSARGITGQSINLCAGLSVGI